MIARECDHCGIAFQARQRRTRFCSRACSSASRKLDRRCQVCGTQIVGRTGTKVRFCSNACVNAANRKPIKQRFWAKVDHTGEGGCWIWLGSTAGNGYGKFNVGPHRGPAFAHRVAYELLIGPIPDGLTLDHLCRTPLCVNPAHLEPVTAAENTRRAFAARSVA